MPLQSKHEGKQQHWAYPCKSHDVSPCNCHDATPAVAFCTRTHECVGGDSTITAYLRVSLPDEVESALSR